MRLWGFWGSGFRVEGLGYLFGGGVLSKAYLEQDLGDTGFKSFGLMGVIGPIGFIGFRVCRVYRIYRAYRVVGFRDTADIKDRA